MGMPVFLKKEGSSLVFTGDGELVFYIPESYFRSDGNMKYAEIAGEYINTLGFFNYEVFDKKQKSIYGVKLFYFPLIVSLAPNQVEKVKEYKLSNDSLPDDYRVCRFKNGDIVILNTKSVQDIANVERVFKIFAITGKIPNTIPYDKLHEYLMSSLKYNEGKTFKISPQLFGILISEICRSRKDESIPFRLSKSNDMHDYRSISVKLVPKYISPFSAIVSENWDEAVVNSILNKDKSVDSPMEKILMQ